MRSDSRHDRSAVLSRAVLFFAAVVPAVWVFLTGLRAVPPSANPADTFARAGYIAAWVLLALLGLRLYRGATADRERREIAERAADESERHSQLIGALAQARTPEAAIEAALQEPLHALAADAGLLVLVNRDGGTVEVVRTVGYRTAEREARTAAALGARTPASDAIGRGAPVLVEGVAGAGEYVAEACAGFGAVAAVPLLVGSRVVAVVQLEFRRPRTFTQADHAYVAALAGRGAQALDRTWQDQSALSGRTEADALRQRAETELAERQHVEIALRASESKYRALVARTARLHGLAAAVSEAATLQAVARAVVRHGRNVLGAASGDVSLLADDGAVFETLFSDVPGAAETGGREPAGPGLCATDAVLTRAPVLVASFEEWQQRYARSAALAADGGCVSSATLPLLLDGAAVGVLAFHFTAPVNFDEDFRGLLVSVAHHCAQAIERARLYEAAQRARAEAETANRHKDQFVSIVSHELRTPLNGILGWTSMLQQGMLDQAASARALQSIVDNATRQIQLVDELLDLSRLQAGRMSFDMGAVDLRALLRGVVESIVPVAASSGLELDVSPVPPATIRGDARRLEQVFLNLLGNALKFTPKGGRVAVQVIAGPGRAQVRVSDTGPGIDPTFIPHLFEAFRQAEDATGRRHFGVGLGLSIAKQLVEAHSGEIVAESGGEGRGATFIVTLPTMDPPAAAESTVVH